MLFTTGFAALAAFLLSASLPTSVEGTSRTVYLDHAMNATDVLNERWYNRSSGLWQEFWWNSGAALATIGDVALLNTDFKATASAMFGDIVVAAKASNHGTFLNTFFDDEGWWAMGWIKAYDVTHDTKYLAVAQEIFEDMATGQQATCGGIWWSKDRTSNSAISNQLFLAVAASLANRVEDQRQKYGEIAQSQVDWLLSSGMVNDNSTFNDGLDISTCKLTGPVYSYNQGVILGGLVEFYKLTGDDAYLDKARNIALGAIKQLATPNHGILTDAGYPGGMDATGAQFKGIFARNLMYLQSVRGRGEYVTFLQKNADSIYLKDRQKDGQMGALWQGPIKSISAAAQVSALDCLMAAARVSPAESLGATATTTTVRTVRVTA
jgi:predicted alpha-1,6-mannanase (GH76 family)